MPMYKDCFHHVFVFRFCRAYLSHFGVMKLNISKYDHQLRIHWTQRRTWDLRHLNTWSVVHSFSPIVGQPLYRTQTVSCIIRINRHLLCKQELEMNGANQQTCSLSTMAKCLYFNLFEGVNILIYHFALLICVVNILSLSIPVSGNIY